MMTLTKFLTYNVSAADTLCHVVTLTSNLLTLNVVMHWLSRDQTLYQIGQNRTIRGRVIAILICQMRHFRFQWK